MSKIFLPLRSNCGWFTSAETREILEYRMKNYVVFYDELLVERGRYSAIYGERGSFDIWMPTPEGERGRTIHYHTPGANFAIRISETGGTDYQQLLGGVAVARYEVDFYPILAEADIASEEYILWADLELTPEGEKWATERAKAATDDETLRAKLSTNRFLQAKSRGLSGCQIWVTLPGTRCIKFATLQLERSSVLWLTV